MLTHLDLFSGIGGFAYAADQVFGDVEHIFCDNEPFSQAVLRKHWPESLILDDVKKIDTNPFDKRLEGIEQEQTTRQRGQSDRTRQDEESRPFILTGGFPCQPFSAAGLRRGTADDRHLWPEMLRVIRLTEPEWVIAENVGGILSWNGGLVFEQVCADLEAAGYAVQPFVIPAVAVNAPHRRDRVWFVAHALDDRPRREKRQGNGASGSLPEKHRSKHSTAGQPERTDSDWQTDGYATDSFKPGLERKPTQAKERQEYLGYDRNEFRVGLESGGRSWNADWTEVAAELCRVAYGLSDWLDFSIGRGVLDGSPSKELASEDLRTLWESLQSPEVREAFGRCYKISEPEVLYQALCELQERGGSVDVHEGGSKLAGQFLRELWDGYEAGRSPRGRRHYQQLAKQHKNLLPQLPYETSLALAEAWYRVRFAQAVYDSEATEGYSKPQHRKEQLKAYGNAIVPQVAMQIMEAIGEASHA